MAATRLSPAGTILRNSRLFAIPEPLPAVSFVSDTATQPHPIFASIETATTSWKRGDWGLKRSLPLKSTTNAGTTSIRVQDGIDSDEHITDFSSAADHVMTLKKWNELHIPIRFPTQKPRNVRMNVFDSSVDNIRPTASATDRRWRYTGPWLAGQTGWEFDALLHKLKDRKEEFRTFVKQRLNAGKAVSQRQESIDAGLGVNQRDEVSVTDQEVQDHMHYLRATPSVFGPLIAEFLDLPEGPSEVGSPLASREPFTYGRRTAAAEIYREIGPPQTHPSAGLSYYGSGSHVFNHPESGPQKENPPVMARIVRPMIRRHAGSVGIAGFIASHAALSNITAGNQTKLWQPQPGGMKKAVRPTMAAIDSTGKLILNAEIANLESQITYGLVRAEKPPELPAIDKTRPQAMPRLDEGRRVRTVKDLQKSVENLLGSSEDRDHI
jgi:hypothetical protein